MEWVSFSRSKGTRRPLFLTTIRSRSWMRSKVVNRPPHTEHTLRRRMTAPSSVGRESVTCVSSNWQKGQRIGLFHSKKSWGNGRHISHDDIKNIVVNRASKRNKR